MLNFERLAEVIATLEDRIQLEPGDLVELDVVLSPIAAETELYLAQTQARIETYQEAIVLQQFGVPMDGIVEGIEESDDDNDCG